MQFSASRFSAVLERRPEKRRSIAALLSGISIEEHSAIMRERYHRLTLETFMTLERQLPPDKLAALVPNLRWAPIPTGEMCLGRSRVMLRYFCPAKV